MALLNKVDGCSQRDVMLAKALYVCGGWIANAVPWTLTTASVAVTLWYLVGWITSPVDEATWEMMWIEIFGFILLWVLLVVVDARHRIERMMRAIIRRTLKKMCGFELIKESFWTIDEDVLFNPPLGYFWHVTCALESISSAHALYPGDVATYIRSVKSKRPLYIFDVDVVNMVVEAKKNERMREEHRVQLKKYMDNINEFAS